MPDVNFDEPGALDNRLLVDHLREARAGRPFRTPTYDFHTSSRRPEPEWVDVHPEPGSILVVEGILTLAVPELRACFDRTAFFETPADLRLARRLLRDVAERGHDPGGVIHQYLTTVRPMHAHWVEPCAVLADVRFDGTLPVDVLVAQMNERLLA